MSNIIKISVPDIGDFIDVPVVEVLVKVGEQVEVDQSRNEAPGLYAGW